MPVASMLFRDESGGFRELKFDRQSTRIGRHSDNDFVVTDPGVSRRHAVVEWNDGTLSIHHLSASSGTYVNDQRVTLDALLHDGDVVRMSQCLFLARHGELQPGDRELLEVKARELEPPMVTMAVAALDTPSTLGLRGEHLSVLTEVSRTLQRLTQLDDILTVLLGVAFDVAAPARGMVLLRDPSNGEMKPVVAHPEGVGEAFSRSVVGQALAQRATIVVADTQSDERFQDIASIEEHAIRSIICCPLIARGEILGALYLDTATAWLHTRDDDVGLLNLIACYAAAAIDGALLLRDLASGGAAGVPGDTPIIARSPAMAESLREVEARADDARPLTIEGETGTGKLLLARHLHRSGRRSAKPFLALDCRKLSGRDLRLLIEGDESGPSGGAWRNAAGGTLVFEHVGALDLLAQQLLVERIQSAAAADEAEHPRLVATTTQGFGALVSKAGFSPRLAELLGTQVVRTPRLRDRQEDILPLASLFLAECAASAPNTVKRLGHSAEKLLLAAKYREGNVAELRATIVLAHGLCEERVIESEQIFTGKTNRNHRFEIDLGASGWIRWLARRRVQRSVQAVVAGIFLSITALCLFASGREAGRVANAVIWGLWWPGLLVLFVAVGRAWCTWCPVSSIATRAQKLWSRGAKPTQWIKENGHWLTAGLFLLIVWTEHVFAMPEHPRASGFFLLSLLTLGLFGALWTQREVWCRYACPLGNLSACYSIPATVHVHANPAICSTQCKTHECHKGSEQEAGCPMYLHPLYLKDAHYCKMCLSCVRNCPNGSARLWLRPPLQDLWSLGEVNPALVPMALTVILLVPLLLASTRGFAITENVFAFTGACLLLAGLAVPLTRYLPGWLSPQRDVQATSRIVFALLVASWGPFLAFHLTHVPGLAGLVVRGAEASAAGFVPLANGVRLLPLLQALLIAASTFASVAILRRLREPLDGELTAIRVRGWRLVVGLCFAYGAASLWMVL